MRIVSRFDHDAAERVATWPVREALEAYMERVRQVERDEYHFQTVVWAVLNPHRKHPIDPPAIPDVLKGKVDGAPAA